MTNHPVRAVDWLEAKTLPNVVFNYYKKIANRLRKQTFWIKVAHRLFKPAN